MPEKKNRYELAGKNIVVYDLEICKPVDQCTNGWSSKDEMGISVGCAFDYRNLSYRVYMSDNIRDLALRLNEPGTLVVAFNQINFDNPLMRASNTGLNPDGELRNYDMMLVSKKALTLGKDGRHKGFTLDSHLRACNLPAKTANGAEAPVWYQQGRIGTLVDYCLSDVQQERALFEYMWVNGTTACAYQPQQYAIERPEIEA